MGQAAVIWRTDTTVGLNNTYELDYSFLGGENHIFCCASGMIQGMLFSSSSGWERLCEYNHSDARG